jgi:holo-[acyl-carrier protein] synthase
MSGADRPTTTPGPLRVGIDLVRVSRVEESLTAFGDRFLRRLFTDDEIAYAKAAPAHTGERLAVRFAAKEAAKKALRGPDGLGWRQIEVQRETSGACNLVLHDEAARVAGPCSTAVSLSHEGDYATAVVLIQFQSTLPSEPTASDGNG